MYADLSVGLVGHANVTVVYRPLSCEGGHYASIAACVFIMACCGLMATLLLMTTQKSVTATMPLLPSSLSNGQPSQS